MGNDKQPVAIKKYANRRLYHTGTSSYVTLQDLAEMVKKGDDFVVFDAKTNEDITRSVLTQIIFEQEGKDGQNLLPITFLRQLIRFYGDSMQALVPSFLEFSIDRLTNEQQSFRDQITGAFTPKGLVGTDMFAAMEEQTRKNMKMFTQAMSMFSPLAQAGAKSSESSKSAEPEAEPAPTPDIEAMKKQMQDMQKQLDSLAKQG
jgi:polyhydroxyalkanoate synthesis repressor PhaR